ncbi:MAG TPA: asparagine synthase (glutamine-hydrolyzing) [Gemmatimonadaceae bacterium]|nr:asparagine synthase (glutamine-hydrolyzing) [Gemmatimonadaceae bacterium]
MCGIVGAYNKKGRPVDEALVGTMRDSLRHRGPDDAGIYVDGSVGLGHRRLSIVDLSPAGHQPMCNEDGTVWLVFNGEIYNYVELARGLRARGHQFRSDTDSEVIIHLYEEEGEDCVRSLNGMFAFVIWDRRTGALFVARDRLGIKPLHYYDDPDWFLCGSEIKALLAHPDVHAAPDSRGIADYLFAGHALGRKTMFSGINQLPPGHCLTVRNGQVRVREYWSPVYHYQWDRPEQRVVSDLADLLDDAVRIHCRSDAALGCHLSGGLDSSLVTALASRHRSNLETFSIRFTDGKYFDEGPHARAVARHLGTRHREDLPGLEDLTAMYATLMWHQDVPMVDAAGFTYWAASRLAARHVKVALTGHGGDEIFGGYPLQFQTAFGSTGMFDLAARPSDASTHGAVARLRAVVRREGMRGLSRRLTRRLTRERPLALGERWISHKCGVEPTTNSLLDRAFRSRLGGYTPRHEYLAPFEQAPTDQPFDQLLHHDLRVYLPSLLHKEDRASMTLSIESRVPLLDYRVIEFLATVPPAQKVPGLLPKALLRAVGTSLLPRSVVDRRDKTPFPSPELQWLAAGRLPMIDSLLREERTLDRGVFAPDELRDHVLEPGFRLTVFNIELWFRLFIDKDPCWLALAADGDARAARVGRADYSAPILRAAAGS